MFVIVQKLQDCSFVNKVPLKCKTFSPGILLQCNSYSITITVLLLVIVSTKSFITCHRNAFICFFIFAECQALARKSVFHPSTGKQNSPRGRPCVWIAVSQNTLKSMIALDENSQLCLWLMKRQLKSSRHSYKNSRY